MRQLSKTLTSSSKIFSVDWLLLQHLFHNAVIHLECTNPKCGTCSSFPVSLSTLSSHLSFQRDVIVQPLEGTQQRFTGVWNLAWAEHRKRERAVCVKQRDEARGHTQTPTTALLAKQQVLAWAACYKVQMKKPGSPIWNVNKRQGTGQKIMFHLNRNANVHSDIHFTFGKHWAVVTLWCELKWIGPHALCHCTASKLFVFQPSPGEID